MSIRPLRTQSAASVKIAALVARFRSSLLPQDILTFSTRVKQWRAIGNEQFDATRLLDVVEQFVGGIVTVLLEVSENSSESSDICSLIGNETYPLFRMLHMAGCNTAAILPLVQQLAVNLSDEVRLIVANNVLQMVTGDLTVISLAPLLPSQNVTADLTALLCMETPLPVISDEPLARSLTTAIGTRYLPRSLPLFMQNPLWTARCALGPCELDPFDGSSVAHVATHAPMREVAAPRQPFVIGACNPALATYNRPLFAALLARLLIDPSPRVCDLALHVCVLLASSTAREVVASAVASAASVDGTDVAAEDDGHIVGRGLLQDLLDAFPCAPLPIVTVVNTTEDVDEVELIPWTARWGIAGRFPELCLAAGLANDAPYVACLPALPPLPRHAVHLLSQLLLNDRMSEVGVASIAAAALHVLRDPESPLFVELCRAVVCHDVNDHRTLALLAAVLCECMRVHAGLCSNPLAHAALQALLLHADPRVQSAALAVCMREMTCATVCPRLLSSGVIEAAFKSLVAVEQPYIREAVALLIGPWARQQMHYTAAAAVGVGGGGAATLQPQLKACLALVGDSADFVRTAGIAALVELAKLTACGAGDTALPLLAVVCNEIVERLSPGAMHPQLGEDDAPRAMTEKPKKLKPVELPLHKKQIAAIHAAQALLLFAQQACAASPAAGSSGVLLDVSCATQQQHQFHQLGADNAAAATRLWQALLHTLQDSQTNVSLAAFHAARDVYREGFRVGRASHGGGVLDQLSVALMACWDGLGGVGTHAELDVPAADEAAADACIAAPTAALATDRRHVRTSVLEEFCAELPCVEPRSPLTPLMAALSSAIACPPPATCAAGGHAHPARPSHPSCPVYSCSNCVSLLACSLQCIVGEVQLYVEQSENQMVISVREDSIQIIGGVASRWLHYKLSLSECSVERLWAGQPSPCPDSTILAITLPAVTVVAGQWALQPQPLPPGAVGACSSASDAAAPALYDALTAWIGLAKGAVVAVPDQPGSARPSQPSTRFGSRRNTWNVTTPPLLMTGEVQLYVEQSENQMVISVREDSIQIIGGVASRWLHYKLSLSECSVEYAAAGRPNSCPTHGVVTIKHPRVTFRLREIYQPRGVAAAAAAAGPARDASRALRDILKPLLTTPVVDSDEVSRQLKAKVKHHNAGLEVVTPVPRARESAGGVRPGTGPLSFYVWNTSPASPHPPVERSSTGQGRHVCEGYATVTEDPMRPLYHTITLHAHVPAAPAAPATSAAAASSSSAAPAAADRPVVHAVELFLRTKPRFNQPNRGAAANEDECFETTSPVFCGQEDNPCTLTCIEVPVFYGNGPHRRRECIVCYAFWSAAASPSSVPYIPAAGHRGEQLQSVLFKSEKDVATVMGLGKATGSWSESSFPDMFAHWDGVAAAAGLPGVRWATVCADALARAAHHMPDPAMFHGWQRTRVCDCEACICWRARLLSALHPAPAAAPAVPASAAGLASSVKSASTAGDGAHAAPARQGLHGLTAGCASVKSASSRAATRSQTARLALAAGVSAAGAAHGHDDSSLEETVSSAAAAAAAAESAVIASFRETTVWGAFVCTPSGQQGSPAPSASDMDAMATSLVCSAIERVTAAEGGASAALAPLRDVLYALAHPSPPLQPGCAAAARVLIKHRSMESHITGALARARETFVSDAREFLDKARFVVMAPSRGAPDRVLRFVRDNHATIWWLPESTSQQQTTPSALLYLLAELSMPFAHAASRQAFDPSCATLDKPYIEMGSDALDHGIAYNVPYTVLQRVLPIDVLVAGVERQLSMPDPGSMFNYMNDALATYPMAPDFPHSVDEYNSCFLLRAVMSSDRLDNMPGGGTVSAKDAGHSNGHRRRACADGSALQVAPAALFQRLDTSVLNEVRAALVDLMLPGPHLAARRAALTAGPYTFTAMTAVQLAARACTLCNEDLPFTPSMLSNPALRPLPRLRTPTGGVSESTGEHPQALPRQGE